MITVMHFMQMGGYGKYVFSAYIIVLLFLLIQWFLPWRSWQRYVKAKNKKYE